MEIHQHQHGGSISLSSSARCCPAASSLFLVDNRHESSSSSRPNAEEVSNPFSIITGSENRLLPTQIGIFSNVQCRRNVVAPRRARYHRDRKDVGSICLAEVKWLERPRKIRNVSVPRARFRRAWNVAGGRTVRNCGREIMRNAEVWGIVVLVMTTPRGTRRSPVTTRNVSE